jgi:CRP/FNR family transcriptional activator FtrB
MRKADLAALRRARLLAAVPDGELGKMLERSFVQALPEGAVLCRQGETPEFLHVVIAGRVGLFGEHGDDEALIEIFGPGDAFIVPAVVLDMPALLTARTLEESRILMWPAAAFREQVRTNGTLAYGAMMQLSGYWRLLIGQLKDLKLRSAIERLSNLLLSLAPRRRGPARVTLPGNRQLVAGMLGVAPQSLSRAFAALRPLGVSGGGREIAITDPMRLRTLTGEAGSKIVPRAARSRGRQDLKKERP